MKGKIATWHTQASRRTLRHVAVSALAAALALILVVVVVSPHVAAQSGGYDLTWSTIDGGGAAFSTGGAYTLGGTIGQLDAGLLSGGPYTLSGGFWIGGGGESGGTARLFIPLVQR